MAFKLVDRGRETSTITSTGAYTVLGAVSGFRAFSSELTTSDTSWFVVEPADENNAGFYEVFEGTFNGSGQIERTSIIKSSNANAAVNWGAGLKEIFCTNAPASYMALLKTLTADLALKAPLASPTFTGTPAAPTASGGTDTTQIATTAFVKAAIDAVKNGVASAFDTLAEIATELALKATLASPTFTGTPAAPTASQGTDTTQIATTAHVLKESSVRRVNTQTGTTYTFVLGDAGKLCTFSNASAITVTVPPNSSVAFDIGTQIDCSQRGAGKTTLAQGAGVTINSKSSNKAIGARYVGVTLVKIATDEWDLYGDLIA